MAICLLLGEEQVGYSLRLCMFIACLGEPCAEFEGVMVDYANEADSLQSQHFLVLVLGMDRLRNDLQSKLLILSIYTVY